VRRALVVGLALAACGPTTPSISHEEAPIQALILTRPTDDTHVGFQVQLRTTVDQAARLDAQTLFPALVTAIQPALTTCAITADDAPTFLWEGELRLSDGAITLFAPMAEGQLRCLADTATGAHIPGPPGLTLAVPMVMVLPEGPTGH